MGHQKIGAARGSRQSTDDSTLYQNGPSFMERHLFDVLNTISDASHIRLGAVGIGYDVDRYYAVSEGADDLTKIPEMIVSVCSKLVNSKK